MVSKIENNTYLLTISSSFRFRIDPSSLQIGQFFNLGWQSLQTTCPLQHWFIGTESIVWKQTGHSRRSLKCFSFNFSIFKDKQCFSEVSELMFYDAEKYWWSFVQRTRWESKAKLLKVNYFQYCKKAKPC